jgi:GNAT superfamily N-acetyltransferase
VLNVMLPAAELERSLYIRDLYVATTARRRGVGRLLVLAAARLVRDGGFCALDWTTDSQNLPARWMYEQCGAVSQDRTYYRLCGEALDDLLSD